jgi:two-component system invasion response regulator UvrY
MANLKRILLVDDHKIVRQGLRILVESIGFEVVGEANTGEEAIKLYPSLIPDLVIMDVNMPGIGGINTIDRILSKYSKALILILSSYDDNVHPRHALQAGARGYLTKISLVEELKVAIKTIFSGKIYVDPIVANLMALDSITGSANPIDLLSKREFETFKLIANGMSVNDVAKTFFISPLTAGSHFTNLKRKLKARNSADLAQIAIKFGYINK